MILTYLNSKARLHNIYLQFYREKLTFIQKHLSSLRTSKATKMADIDFRKVCIKFKEKLAPSFIAGVERRIGQDFEKALEEKPELLLTNILQNIHLTYIIPLEMTLELSEYLEDVHGISKFSLALSQSYDFPASEKTDEASRIVNSFYEMVEALGLKALFERKKEKWWKRG